MAAPTLYAEGATATGVTTGVPTVTIPTHAADDILIVTAVHWGPSGTQSVDLIPTPSTWALLGSQVSIMDGAEVGGRTAVFWKRAAGAGTTVTLTRGANWDTGTDTVYNARAYVIRGCDTAADPWDAATNSGPHTAANQNIPAITVSAAGRLVIVFGISSDNAAFAMASSGFTEGTEDDDAGGLDSAFQTIRIDNASASTSAQAATVAAPAQGGYAFHGVSFRSSIAGTGAATLAALTAAGTAAVSPRGAGAATLAALTAAGTGIVQVPANGTGTATLAALTAAGGATVQANAAGAATLDAVTIAGTAAAKATGAGTAALDAVTIAGTGTAAASTRAYLSWAEVRIPAVGGTRTGALGVTLDAVTASGTAAAKATGTGATTLGTLTAAGNATVQANASAAVTLGALTQAGTGSVAGARAYMSWAEVRLPLVTGTHAGSLAQTLGALTASGTATV